MGWVVAINWAVVGFGIVMGLGVLALVSGAFEWISGRRRKRNGKATARTARKYRFGTYTSPQPGDPVPGIDPSTDEATADVIGLITAARSWQVVESDQERDYINRDPYTYLDEPELAPDLPRWLLMPYGAGVGPWVPGPNEARCERHAAVPAHEHQVPHKSCGCGFWGLTDWVDARRKAGEGRSHVLGVIEMWGHIIPGTDGWRAQFARPAALISPTATPDPMVFGVAKGYGIPVLNYLPELTASWDIVPKEKPRTQHEQGQAFDASGMFISTTASEIFRNVVGAPVSHGERPLDPSDPRDTAAIKRLREALYGAGVANSGGSFSVETRLGHQGHETTAWCYTTDTGRRWRSDDAGQTWTNGDFT